jgi:hypothetical protein
VRCSWRTGIELSNKGVINANEFVSKLQEIAITHRETGDPNKLADAIHALSEHIHESIVNDP